MSGFICCHLPASRVFIIPIEYYQRKDAFCFAGAYYVRYPERTKDLEAYIEEFPKFKPLEIYDRNFGKDDVNYQFPPIISRLLWVRCLSMKLTRHTRVIATRSI
jgi:hypothetical protein